MATNNYVVTTGPIPCSVNKLYVGDTKETAVIPSDIETIEVELTYERKEYFPHDTGGIGKVMDILTGCTVNYNGKLNDADTGNNYLASKFGKNMHELEGYCRVELANGRVVEMENAVYNNPKFGGATNDLIPVEGSIKSNGNLSFSNQNEPEAGTFEE